MKKIIKSLDTFFEITENGSNIKTEVLAGTSVFVTIVYIFIVNPAILSQAGLNREMVLFASIITSGFATILMGIYAKAPFTLAPGMEMNSYFVFILFVHLNFSGNEALGIVFGCGTLFIIANMTNLRIKLLNQIPLQVQFYFTLAMGCFLLVIGLKLAGITQYNDFLLFSGFGDFTANSSYAFYISIFVLFFLEVLNIKGAIIISVIITSIFSYFNGMIEIDKLNEISIPVWYNFEFAIDFSVFKKPTAYAAIITLFIIDFFGSLAKIIGLTAEFTPSFYESLKGKLKKVLYIDGIATVFGSILGTSNVTIYVENAVTLRVGGRTGLSAVVSGILIFSCIILIPYLSLIPLEATVGVLVYVGFLIMKLAYEQLKKIDSRLNSVMLFLVPSCIFFTLSLDKAIFLSLLTFSIRGIFKEKNESHGVLWGATIILFIAIIFQYI